MRELTEKEINDAPEWATHYSVARSGGVHYYKSASGLKKIIPRKEFEQQDPYMQTR